MAEKKMLARDFRKQLTAPAKAGTKATMFAPSIRTVFPDARPAGVAAHITQAWLWWRNFPSAAASMRLW